MRVTWSGGLPHGIESRGRTALGRLTPAPQTATVLLLASAFEEPRAGRPRRVVQLAGIRPLARWVRLRSGRLPRRCDARVCEVLGVGGPRAPDVLARGRTRFVTVGRGTLRSPVPLGFVPGPELGGRSDEAAPKALLVAGDPRAVEDEPALASVYRTHGWTAPLDAASTPSWELDGLRTRIEGTDTALRVGEASFSVTGPTAALAVARDRAREARRRVVLVGAGAAALLAAFALLVAGTLRPDLAAERARLERLGARRWQRGALGLAEAAWPAGLGCLGGAALAVGATAARADRAGLATGALLGHGLLTPDGALVLLGCFAAATALLTLGATAWRGDGTGRLADVLALGAAGAVALALARGGVRAGDGDDPLPLLLPPLACLAAGLVVARGAAPALRTLERLARRGPLSLRLAALGLARAPDGPARTVAVVAVSAGLACFAAAYGATLERGTRDQAAFAVPLDVTVAEGPDLVPPLVAAGAARWRGLTGGGAVVPVQRASATVPRGATRVELPLVALPAEQLGRLRGWRASDASAPRAALARRLAPRPVAPAGPVVAPSARSLAVTASTAGGGLQLVAHLVDAAGTGSRVALGVAGTRPRRLRAAIPPSRVARRLVALELQVPDALRATDGHQEAENASSRDVISGRLTLRRLAIDGARVGTAGWIGRGPARDPVADGAATRAAYRFDPADRAFLRPRQPTDDAPIPVLADPQTARGAARGGLLPIDVGGTPLRARVVGTVTRFATVGPDADGVVVADEPTLRTALSADAPGTGRPDELWLSVAPGAPQRRLLAAFSRGSLTTLRPRARRDVQAGLHDDPLARELARTLGLAALVALATAAVGVLLAGGVALRDESAARYDLEALGVGPGTLRADVRLRAALVTGLGLLAGLAIGATLLGLVVDAVGVTAAGAVAVPPLRAVVPWGSWLALAAGVAGAVGLGTALTTRRAFGQDVPARPAGAAP